MAQSCQTKRRNIGIIFIIANQLTCVNLIKKKLSNKHAHKCPQGTEYLLQIKFYSFNSTKNFCVYIDTSLGKWSDCFQENPSANPNHNCL